MTPTSQATNDADGHSDLMRPAVRGSFAAILHAEPPQSMDPATPVNVAKGAVLTCEFVLRALTVAAPSLILTILPAPCKQPLRSERSLQPMRSTGGRVIQRPLPCLPL